MARKHKSLGREGNSERYEMTWKQLLGAAAFVRGFKEVRAGKPFDYDRPPSDGWSYERGRLFGVVYSGKIKEGNRVLAAAIYAAAEAFRDKALL